MITSLLIASALQAPAPLLPNGKWQVSPVAFSCSLARTFGTGKDELTLQIAPEEATTAYNLLVVAQRDALPIIAPGGKSVISTDDGLFHSSFAVTQNATDGRRVLRTQLSRAFVDAVLASAKTMTITSGKYSASLSASGLKNALSVLKTCHTDALRGWGVDPALWFEDRLAHLNNPGRFFSDDDSPKAADGSRLSGRVIVLLGIDTAGKVSRCMPVGEANAELAKATCVIAQAKISARPAVDVTGKAIDGYSFLPVAWAR